MPVQLLPPVSSSMGRPDAVPLTEANRYVRTRGMSRWHRVRSGRRYADGRVTYGFWCGPFAHGGRKQGGPPLLTDEVPVGEQVCGTCEGRALGAGQDVTPDGMPDLRFDPRWLRPPAVCPGSSKQDLLVALDDRLRVGRCLVCGVFDSIRALGRGIGSYGYGLVKHSPGPDLVQPCPWHAWQYLTRRGDVAGCSCGWSGGEAS